jgi:glycosyltransferase involved in cell wall biosynthesis
LRLSLHLYVFAVNSFHTVACPSGNPLHGGDAFFRTRIGCAAPMTSLTVPIEILLSTYNGAKYLDALLESIVAQDHEDWSLLIRDDGSTDLTKDIVQRWRRDHPNKINVIDEKLDNNLGAVRSFSRLMELSTAPYVMFADQDDVWLPGKVRLTLEAMRRQESKSGSARPVLVHTDLAIVDENLRVVSKSLWDYQGLVPRRNPKLSMVMLENCAWGCAVMLNRALVTAVRSIPPEAVHHDWWIALVAAAFGTTIPIHEQPILYRRHGGNESEISNVREVSRSGLADWRVPRRRLAQLLEEGRLRVLKFLEVYGGQMSPHQIAAAEAFLHLHERGFVGRRVDILRYGLSFSGLPRTLGLLLLV